jgi:hypothetical protein
MLSDERYDASARMSSAWTPGSISALNARPIDGITSDLASMSRCHASSACGPDNRRTQYATNSSAAVVPISSRFIRQARSTPKSGPSTDCPTRFRKATNFNRQYLDRQQESLHRIDAESRPLDLSAELGNDERAAPVLRVCDPVRST